MSSLATACLRFVRAIWGRSQHTTRRPRNEAASSAAVACAERGRPENPPPDNGPASARTHRSCTPVPLVGLSGQRQQLILCRRPCAGGEHRMFEQPCRGPPAVRFTCDHAVHRVREPEPMIRSEEVLRVVKLNPLPRPSAEKGHKSRRASDLRCSSSAEHRWPLPRD